VPKARGLEVVEPGRFSAKSNWSSRSVLLLRLIFISNFVFVLVSQLPVYALSTQNKVTLNLRVPSQVGPFKYCFRVVFHEITTHPKSTSLKNICISPPSSPKSYPLVVRPKTSALILVLSGGLRSQQTLPFPNLPPTL